MFAQLQAGMRGLQLVYNSVSRLLVDLRDNPEPAPFPKGWAPDPDAFKAGLDLSTRELTTQDRDRITSWYEQTIGYVPNSVTVLDEVPPRVLQVAPRPLGGHLPDSCRSRPRRTSCCASTC